MTKLSGYAGLAVKPPNSLRLDADDSNDIGHYLLKALIAALVSYTLFTVMRPGQAGGMVDALILWVIYGILDYEIIRILLNDL